MDDVARFGSLIKRLRIFLHRDRLVMRPGNDSARRVPLSRCFTATNAIGMSLVGNQFNAPSSVMTYAKDQLS
jgi:hypothetical protein